MIRCRIDAQSTWDDENKMLQAVRRVMKFRGYVELGEFSSPDGDEKRHYIVTQFSKAQYIKPEVFNAYRNKTDKLMRFISKKFNEDYEALMEMYSSFAVTEVGELVMINSPTPKKVDKIERFLTQQLKELDHVEKTNP